LLAVHDELIAGHKPWPKELEDWMHHVGGLGGTPYPDLESSVATWVRITHGVPNAGDREVLGLIDEQQRAVYFARLDALAERASAHGGHRRTVQTDAFNMDTIPTAADQMVTDSMAKQDREGNDEENPNP
jgi:hypothetical protein